MTPTFSQEQYIHTMRFATERRKSQLYSIGKDLPCR